jgi:hypothetical protein
MNSIQIVSDLPPNAVENEQYTPFVFSAQGGKKPYRWFGSNIPEGMMLTSDGILFGAPMFTGQFNVTITVVDNSR